MRQRPGVPPAGRFVSCERLLTPHLGGGDPFQDKLKQGIPLLELPSPDHFQSFSPSPTDVCNNIRNMRRALSQQNSTVPQNVSMTFDIGDGWTRGVWRAQGLEEDGHQAVARVMQRRHFWRNESGLLVKLPEVQLAALFFVRILHRDTSHAPPPETALGGGIQCALNVVHVFETQRYGMEHARGRGLACRPQPRRKQK